MSPRGKPTKSRAQRPAPRTSPKKKTTPSTGRELAKRLAEALEQQAAASEILRVIHRSPGNVQPVFDAIVANAGRLCEAEFSAVARFDAADGLLHLVALHNMSAEETKAFHSLFPRPPRRNFVVGRAFVDGAAVHIEDVLADRDYDPRTRRVLQSVAGYRTFLGVPISRDGVPIGVIGCARRVVKPFTPTQIELVKTFADQAVIAIENVRLFTESDRRNRDLGEALEQQTATGEILRVISRSPTDIRPVFDAVAQSAARLCESFDSAIWRRDGDRLVLVAHHGPIPIGPVGEFSLPLVRGIAVGRTGLDGHAVHVADMQAETDEFPQSSENARRMGFRTILCVPLIRDGRAVGVIQVRRTESRLFTERQVALLQTFADQAVIAIENVRLFTELEGRNRDLSESLEQQTATGEILRVISSSPTDVQPVFDAVAESAARLCDVSDVTIFRRDDDALRLVAHHGPIPVQRALPVVRGTSNGRAVLEGRSVHIADMQAETAEFPEGSENARLMGHRTILCVPLMREGVAIGTIHLRRAEAQLFSDRQVALLQTFADQAVIAVENVRLVTEVQAQNRALTESLEQQTATGEILRVISSSPTDVQPVLHAVAENAARLCEAEDVSILEEDGGVFRVTAVRGHDNSSFEGTAVSRDSVAGRAMLDRQLVHVHDIANESEFPVSQEYARRVGNRTMLAVPLLREGASIGAIFVRRTEVRPFSEKQIELLQTFADQAVIAIENVRLFRELEARNGALTESLEQQTATGEILRVISSSPTDAQPVFDAIVRSASRLCGGEHAIVTRYDGEFLHLAAQHNPRPRAAEETEILFPQRPRRDTSLSSRALVDGRAVHVPDVAREILEPSVRESYRRMSLQALLAVPMIHEGRPIGVVSVSRGTPGPFSDRQVALLQTFADQAVIAIENVRLFTELEARNHDLTVSLEQQTATAEVLRVIASAQTDTQPVFDTIVRNAVRLCGGVYATLYRVEGRLIHFVAHHNFTDEQLEQWRRTFPRPVDGTGVPVQRAVRTGTVYRIGDAGVEPDDDIGSEARAGHRARGLRSLLVVPMFRQAEVIGAIGVTHVEKNAFTDAHVELLKTFADQAVIAVENVRLFRELEARNSALIESLEQQTATSEILRVISSSPTEVQPVFDAIAASARRLCDGTHSGVLIYDGSRIHLKAIDAFAPQGAESLGHAFPMPPSRASSAARAILGCEVAQIPDVLEDPEYRLASTARISGFRSVVAVPMLRDGHPIGVINVTRAAPGVFPDRQIELLKTFADQAVIAIENVRLFKELEARNGALTESLEQQTATGEILRVISSSPTDVQPVFDTIVGSAVRLCDGLFSALFRFDGELIHQVAQHNFTPEALEQVRRLYPAPPSRAHGSGRAILERAVVHIPDVELDPEYRHHDLTRAVGLRSGLYVPMMREGEPVGVVMVARAEPGPFSDRQIALLQTFADQAVIAVENVRLFTELEARNSALTDSLEQQTATSEILRAISSSPTDVQPVFDTIVRSAVSLCGAVFGNVQRFDGELMHLAAHYGHSQEWLAAMRQMYPRLPDRTQLAGRAVLTRSIVHVPDVLEDPEYSHDIARAGDFRALVSVPMLRAGDPIGVITVASHEPRPFSDGQVALLKTFADQAVIAIENVRLFKELEARNGALTESLEQQTATGEILRVISSSRTDVQPVFDTIAERAVKLCNAELGVVSTIDNGTLRLAAMHGLTGERADATRRAFPMPIDAESTSARAVRSRAVAQFADAMADPGYEYKDAAQVGRWRATLAAPMLRGGDVVGAIFVARAAPGAFRDSQVELLKTFADQAVIAIENVRLFAELESRTRELTRSVGELRALGEVSQAVGSTLDLETVLATIVSRAVQLSGSASGIVYQFDEATQTFHATATHQVTSSLLDAVRAAPIRLGEGAVGHAGVIREPVQIADIKAERQLVLPQTRALLLREGMGSLLAVPLIRDDRLLGGLVITRRERGEFSPEVVATLQTFATQSVLAIHNAGLFREIQRQKQYADALVETSPVAIATMDLLGTVVGWNPGAERLFGYTQAEAIGRLLEDLVATPETREEVRAGVQQGLQGERRRLITRRARKDGTLVDVEISAMPVVVGGEEVAIVATYHDITELLRARREAEAANEAKSAFLATMSHEIRTPMNAVIGMSGLLLNTSLNDEQREYAEVVRQSGDALLTVINDILDFSKIEAGKLELEFQPFDLRECVEGALDLVATRAAEKGIDLAYLIAEGTPAGLVGDVTRLRQIFLNLLSNAVKFTERGEVVLSTSARPLGGAAAVHELTFTVRDTGIGIPADRLGRLFQSFSQVDASTTRRYGGTGLGLAISQRLTELMGGRISVTSRVGVGSEFRFTIRATASDVPASSRRDLSGVQPTLRDKRVLVVDDNATNRRVLSAHLEAWGMQTRATESPTEALAWIRADERFDVGILDMHMPEMDGVTLAHALREQPAGATLPLVLFTSLGRREARAEAEGFAAYLNKPIKPSQLFDALVSVLPDQPVHVPQRGTTRSEFDPDLARRHPLRILLAEDNVVNQKLALRLLAQMGYRADLASNGLEAIAAVERQTYDVVLMDVQMPELDGLEASREINGRWPGARRPRLVAMTANAMQGDRELCVAAGMDDYVAKPIRVEELVAALERCGRRTGASVPAAAAVSDGTSSTEAVDRSVIDRLVSSMGGPFVGELIDTFIEDSRNLVATLQRAGAARDLEAFRRAAHSLKSTGEALGASALSALARELELLARAGSLDGAEARLDPLVARYEATIHALGELRRDLSA